MQRHLRLLPIYLTPTLSFGKNKLIESTPPTQNIATAPEFSKAVDYFW
jgi:hypothetical protein